MGGFKKYEGHARRYSLCCFPADIRLITLVIGSTGVVLCTWYLVSVLLLTSIPNGEQLGGGSLQGWYVSYDNLAFVYLMGFASLLIGELSKRPSYFIIFLLFNGFTVILSLLSILTTLVMLAWGPGPLGYNEHDVDDFFQHYWQGSFGRHGQSGGVSGAPPVVQQPSVTIQKTFGDREEVILSLYLLLSSSTSVFLLATILQSVVFHAYRFAQLRLQFNYPAMDMIYPNGGCASNPRGGNGSGRGSPPGGHYISNMKKTSIFSHIPHKG